MKLYIAEKPSLGRAIVDALPKPHHKAEGCVYVGHKDQDKCDVVSWCVGHLLEQAEPEDYDAQLKKWSFDHLPISPGYQHPDWQLKPKRQTRKQLTLLKQLVKRADQVIHCGDPDREGQLLVDEVLHYSQISKLKNTQVQRCLISDLNLPAVKRALSQLRLNSEFKALSISALARTRADWLYGMNLTRAFTLQAKKHGFNGLISVGRVQTPVLGMVVRRDKEIELFRPHDYFQVEATMQTQDQEEFVVKWQPSDACEKYMDTEGRVISKALAENVAKRIAGKPGLVEAYQSREKKQSAPLPYNLSALQIDAAKRFGMSAKVVLDVCQNLYEQHKLITYPRSDCRYLPEEHFYNVNKVLDAVASLNGLSDLCNKADVSKKSRAWNDKKVSAHHAIIPTEKRPSFERLSQAEQKIYTLIAKQYLMQFYSDWRYCDVQAEIRIEGGLFIAKSRQTLELGWKELINGDGEKSSANEGIPIPRLKQGQTLDCTKSRVLEKQTEPPKAFTDASLLAAMTGIARFVEDPELKKVLKATDGLGTEATRASIIELLFKRQFLERKGKAIHATKLGQVIISNLPEAVTKPDMTAKWELSLAAMAEQHVRYDDFMQPLLQQLDGLVEYGRSATPQNISSLALLSNNLSRPRGKGRSRRGKSTSPAAKRPYKKSKKGIETV